MEVTGKIKLIKPTEEKGSKGFKVREMVVTTNDQYPQHLLIQFTQDRTDLLDNYQVGQDVKVSVNLRGREWTNPQGEVRYFNSIDGWRIEDAAAQQQPQNPQQSSAPQQNQAPAPQQPEQNSTTFDDDLPF